MTRARGGPQPARRWLCRLVLCLGLAVAFPALAEDASAACDRATLASLDERYAVAALRDAAGPGSGSGIVVAQACKPWPYDEDILLAAVAYSQSPPETEPGERRLGLIVAMLDRTSRRVLSGYTNIVEEDAMTELGPGALRLDTARYDLAPGVRAIGVGMRSSARGASCPDRWFNNELRLLMRDGERLRPVLATYLHGWALVAGEVCGPSVTGAVSEVARIDIGVEQTRSHGYADLRLIARVERTETPAQSEGGQDDIRQSTRKASRVLHYDGASYSLDAFANSNFWIDEK